VGVSKPCCQEYISCSNRVCSFYLGASADLDIASTDMLKNLVEELRDQDIRFLIADAKSPTRERLEHTGLLERIGEYNIYLRVPEAVADATVENNSGKEGGRT